MPFAQCRSPSSPNPYRKVCPSIWTAYPDASPLPVAFLADICSLALSLDLRGGGRRRQYKLTPRSLRLLLRVKSYQGFLASCPLSFFVRWSRRDALGMSVSQTVPKKTQSRTTLHSALNLAPLLCPSLHHTDYHRHFISFISVAFFHKLSPSPIRRASVDGETDGPTPPPTSDSR